ncbi:MAG: nucleotide-binding universal stress UspA family protein [Sphingobacteriales bacterium]|jgi:nucleotide-binding universal stress UspA family protein
MSNSKQIIIVPTDFSDNALIALHEAIDFSETFPSEIILFHSVETYLLNTVLRKTIGFNKERNASLLEAVDIELGDLAKTVGNERNITIKTYIATGKVYSELGKYASKIKADFIVMGTHGATGLEKLMLGTNATRVAATAPCPVITIREKSKNRGVGTIVLPLDLTKETRQKVNRVIELAKKFKATIHVISIQNTTDEFLVNSLKRQLNQVKAFIAKENIKVVAELIMVNEKISDAVLDYAEKVEAGLIVIMSQSESGISDWVLGTSAENVIKSSHIPVLTITPVEIGKAVFNPY